MDQTSEIEYWDKFYAKSGSMAAVAAPSQFAAFCLLDMQENGIAQVYDLGCGNGRDSLFFLRHGMPTTAMDRSEAAIEAVRNLCSRYADAAAHVADLSQDFSAHVENSPQPKALYARFYLHALLPEQVQAFLTHCAAVMQDADRLYLEYRTPEDMTLSKTTAAHYRNFIPPTEVKENCARHGLTLAYQVTGVGFAKWKTDDAHVARQIFCRAKPAT